MLAKRIIPCLDVKQGQVVKGVKFKNHVIVGDIVQLATRYAEEGADELVFYDITASTEKRVVDNEWVKKVAEVIDIPFCVAGGIQTIEQAKDILTNGADKISINSPAINNPNLITKLTEEFGQQSVVIGIDSYFDSKLKDHFIFKYTGDPSKSENTKIKTLDWVKKVQTLGAGEIVLNTMNNDGVRQGYNTIHLKNIRDICNIPLIASGGAGKYEHFKDVFINSNVDGALAASVFHNNLITIPNLKKYLLQQNIRVRMHDYIN